MNGNYVGRWTVSPGGAHQLCYARSWMESTDCRPLSLSLPLLPVNQYHKGSIVENYFDNLLPDSDIIRQRIQRRFGTASRQSFELLTEIGRDCIGAVQLMPENMEPSDVKTINGEMLSDDSVEKVLRTTTADDIFRIENADDFRISLAGAQEKNALTFLNGRWTRPQGATPSTHIFKLPMGSIGIADMSASVENEWLCVEVLNRYGLRTATSRIEVFGDQKALVVERFDRRFSKEGNWIIRLPQEDFCQAKGLPSGLKYESDGGPGIKAISDTLLYSANSIEDRKSFMKAQILFWLLAAPDGHAKNYSIFLERGGSYRLTPFYDIMSAYPVMGSGTGKIHPSKLKMAMAVTGKARHYNWQKIRRDHWLTTAGLCGINNEVTIDIFNEIIEMTPTVIEVVKAGIPPGFPEQVAASILGGLEAAVKKLS